MKALRIIVFILLFLIISTIYSSAFSVKILDIQYTGMAIGIHKIKKYFKEGSVSAYLDMWLIFVKIDKMLILITYSEPRGSESPAIGVTRIK